MSEQSITDTDNKTPTDLTIQTTNTPNAPNTTTDTTEPIKPSTIGKKRLSQEISHNTQELEPPNKKLKTSHPTHTTTLKSENTSNANAPITPNTHSNPTILSLPTPHCKSEPQNIASHSPQISATDTTDTNESALDGMPEPSVSIDNDEDMDCDLDIDVSLSPSLSPLNKHQSTAVTALKSDKREMDIEDQTETETKNEFNIANAINTDTAQPTQFSLFCLILALTH